MGSVCSATHQPGEKVGNIPPKLAESAFIAAQHLKQEKFRGGEGGGKKKPPSKAAPAARVGRSLRAGGGDSVYT